MEKTAIESLFDELEEQINQKFVPEIDPRFTKGELIRLASYCLESNRQNLPKCGWIIDYTGQHFHLLSRKRQLIIAASLIIREINRRDRLGIDALNELCNHCENKDKCYEDGILRINCPIISNFNKEKEDE
jgi:hypothetical protein